MGGGTRKALEESEMAVAMHGATRSGAGYLSPE
jgi:hypothetical protein